MNYGQFYCNFCYLLGFKVLIIDVSEKREMV